MQRHFLYLDKKIVITVISLLLLLIAAIIGYFKIKSEFREFLSTPKTFGDVKINLNEYSYISLFEHKWKAIDVETNGLKLSISNPNISLHLLLRREREILRISADSVKVKIEESVEKNKETNSVSAQLEKISHPDIWFPFRIYTVVKHSDIFVDSLSWSFDSLKVIKSAKKRSLSIDVNSIRGSYLAGVLDLNVNYMWGKQFCVAAINVNSKNILKDSITILMNAPREHLEDLSGKISASINNLPYWLDGKYPDAAPTIGKIYMNSNVSMNILKKRIYYDLSLKTNIGSLWQLPPFDGEIQIKGNEDLNFYSNVNLNSAGGASIRWNGMINSHLDGYGSLDINGINLFLGNETLPVNVSIDKIAKKGNYVTANLNTKSGSHITASIQDINNPIVEFSSNISNNEPWAVQWTHDNVKLAGPTIIEGTFSINDILLKANAYTSTPFAYYVAADEFRTSLWLDKNGIRFPEGRIKRNNIISDFSGEVIWEENKEYFSFKLNQQNGGEVEASGLFKPTIDLKISEIELGTLPFADTSMLRGMNGIVNASLQHDFVQSQGEAILSLSTAIKNIDLKAYVNVDVSNDTLKVTDFSIEQGNRRIRGFLEALLPNDTGREFELQNARIDIPRIYLVSLARTFQSSDLTRGFIEGSVNLDKEEGLSGSINLTQLAFRNIDSTVLKVPNLTLTTQKHSATLSGDVSLGMWSGKASITLDNLIKSEQHPISISYLMNGLGNTGNFSFEGMIDKGWNLLSGNAELAGNWFLPSGIGELRDFKFESSLNIPLSKNIIDSAQVSFEQKNKGVFAQSILKLPFDFSGKVRNGLLSIDSLHILGEKDEKITAVLQYNLQKNELNNLSFNTKSFSLPLFGKHHLQIQNLSGQTKINPNNISISADFPRLTYKLNDPDWGTANALLHGKVEYIIPIQEEKTRTNSRITGDIFIDNARYENQIDIDIRQLGKVVTNLFSRKKGKVENVSKHANVSRPTILDVRVKTIGIEPVIIKSNVVSFPLSVNLSLLGDTKNMLLSGDVNASGNGTIGYGGFTTFELSSFRLFWREVSVGQGSIELRASRSYKACSSTQANDKPCDISMNIDGQISQFKMQPGTTCDIEASPALIYYSVLLDCISDGTDFSSIDMDKMIGKALGMGATYAANRIIGTNVFGDIDFKWNIANGIQDTNRIQVPISLTNDLHVVLGYTEDRSLEQRYDKSYEASLKYALSIFDSTDINRNLIDPSLDLSTGLITRTYLPSAIDDQANTKLEWNIGLKHAHKFWDSCILGLGRCRSDKSKVTDAHD